MLTTLSVLGRDQGPKWQEPRPPKTTTPEASPGRLQGLMRAALAVLAALSRRPAPSRSRA
jgi:hypothetical protein